MAKKTQIDAEKLDKLMKNAINMEISVMAAEKMLEGTTIYEKSFEQGNKIMEHIQKMIAEGEEVDALVLAMGQLTAAILQIVIETNPMLGLVLRQVIVDGIMNSFNTDSEVIVKSMLEGVEDDTGKEDKGD